MKEYSVDFYNSLLGRIQEVTSYMHYHSLWDFLNNKEHNEFRLDGKFGFGLKLRKQHNRFYFTQYQEDETPESIKWITEQNKFLKDFPIDEIF